MNNISINLMKEKIFSLLSRELRWLNSSRYLKQHPNTYMNNYSFTFEIALTLMGIKPCVIISHFDFSEFGKEFFKEVLQIWMHDFDIYRLGFDAIVPESLVQVTDDICTNGLRKEASLIPHHPGFGCGKSVVFVNTKHAHFNRITQLLSQDIINNAELGKLLGYPGTQSSKQNYQRIAYLVDVNEANISGRFPVTEYDAVSTEAADVGLHFKEANVCFRDNLNLKLLLDLSDCRGWSKKQMNRLTTAAFDASVNINEKILIRKN
jgi:hypothetical protein